MDVKMLLGYGKVVGIIAAKLCYSDAGDICYSAALEQSGFR